MLLLRWIFDLTWSDLPLLCFDLLSCPHPYLLPTHRHGNLTSIGCSGSDLIWSDLILTALSFI